MAKIYIGFSTPKKCHIFPCIIKLIEGTKFSHTYLKIKSDSLEREFIYQASGLKVNFMNKQLFEQINQVVVEFELEVTEQEYKKVLQFAIDNVGVEYNFCETVGFLWVRFMSLFGKKVKNPIRDGIKEQICTELVSTILKECLNYSIEDTESMGLQEVYKTLKGEINGKV